MCVAKVMKACDRKSLAESAMYEFPRGGSKVTGPSIRMAEVLAQNWGNIDFGIMELEQKNGESTVMAYAWDLETNTRQTKIFTVKHERKAKGKVNKLDDPRDIYEMVANQGARRLRVIPGDIVDSAIDRCQETLKNGHKEPLQDRVRNMITQFQVNKAMLENYIGCSADAILVIWIKLLTLAGKCNAGGYIFLTESIPYTDEMLSHKFKGP
ncbi:hypothetical protein C4A76_09695 [Brevibacillus laterosporus]|nr:hypothetical protein C4A76_09695 [Brevibacillus laterosporus]